MRIIPGHLGHQDPVDQVYSVMVAEDALVDHALVLPERQPVEWHG
jgi:hypothetical protein